MRTVQSTDLGTNQPTVSAGKVKICDVTRTRHLPSSKQKHHVMPRNSIGIFYGLHNSLRQEEV